MRAQAVVPNAGEKAQLAPLPQSSLLNLLMKPFLLFLLCTAAVSAQTNPAQQQRQRTPSKAEWLDSNQQTPNARSMRLSPAKCSVRTSSRLVWVPPGYDQDQKRYPVIYWLHGIGREPARRRQMFVPHVLDAIKEGTLPPCIVVLVNGMVRSFYCDSTDGKVPMESVIVKDLIPHVDAAYRTLAKREGRIIEGFSMGGYGAAHLGFKYPDLFGTVVINAGALIDPNLDPPKDGAMDTVFGGDKDRRIAEHPMQLARKNAGQLRGHTHIRIGCGSLDGLLPRNKELHDLLTDLKIDHDFQIVPDVAHNSPLYYRKLGAKVYEFTKKVSPASAAR